MTVRTTKLILAGGALALTLAMPAAYAQTMDAPSAPPVSATSRPAVAVAPLITGFSPGTDEIGRTVTVRGSGFTGATAVSVNGIPAAHVVSSDTLLTLTIPDGAATGLIAVTTPGGTATSADSLAVGTVKKRNRFRIGPEVGVYLPTSSKTRDQFGNTWYTVGLGLGNINKITAKGQTTFDLQILYQKKGDNHAFLAPIGVGYRQAFSQTAANTAYYGVTGDLYLADLRSGDYGVHSGLRTGVGGSALVGINFGDSGYLEARYLLVSRIKGFDLSGLNLTAGYRF